MTLWEASQLNTSLLLTSAHPSEFLPGVKKKGSQQCVWWQLPQKVFVCLPPLSQHSVLFAYSTALRGKKRTLTLSGK